MTVYPNKRSCIEAEIRSTDVVCDVGFVGQGITEGHTEWGHDMLRARANDVYGIDLQPYASPDPSRQDHYQQTSAEAMSFGRTFDVIYGGDVIEHLTNPGLFLDACAKNLAPEGRLILITPNTFHLFNLTAKLAHDEPVVNHDHVCYYNKKTITTLLRKHGWRVERFGYIYSLDMSYQESWKKKLLNVLYRVVSWLTPKFLDTLVVVAVRDSSVL